MKLLGKITYLGIEEKLQNGNLDSAYNAVKAFLRKQCNKDRVVSSAESNILIDHREEYIILHQIDERNM